MSRQGRRLIMIGNSHIDPVWLWTEDEGLQEVKATFASALARMDEFPEFQFSASSAALYDWVRKNHRGLFREMKRRVREGRWHLVGGWWVEPDLNAPSGESLVRQGLYGQRFFRKHFGKSPRVAFNVDAFGHSMGIPAILRGQGITGAVFMRPNQEQMALPGELFQWLDDAGLPVLACRISGEYCAWTKTAILSNVRLALKTMESQGLTCFPAYYGVGNHGGGPTVENIKAVRELQQEMPEASIMNGSLETCLDAWAGLALPEYKGELQGVFPGCYSADTQVKTFSRQAEAALTRAETLGALALPLGFSYPEKALRRAWKTLLFQQFHDTLAGTARKEARDEAVLHLHACLSAAGTAARDAVQAIAARVDTRGDGQALLLVNPCGMDYEGLVEADLYWRSKFPLRVKNAAGEEVACDLSSHGLVAPDARKHAVFYASVPAFGYALCRLMPETPTKAFPGMGGEGLALSGQALRLFFGGDAGLFQATGADGQPLFSGAPSLRVYEDTRDTWGASGQVGPLLGEYAISQARVIERGAVRGMARISCEYNRSRVEMQVSLGMRDSCFTLEGVLQNHERLAMTVLRLPLAFQVDSVLAEAPYAEITRPAVLGSESPWQRYAQAEGEGKAVLLVGRGSHAYRLAGGALEIILSRSPLHAFPSGQTPTEEAGVVSDQGELPFTLRIYPDSRLMEPAERIAAADALHSPLAVLACDSHAGCLSARSASLASAEGLLVRQFKKAEDGGVAARLHNPNPLTAQGAITWQGRKAEVSLPPHGLATLVCPDSGKPFVANLLEDPLPAPEQPRKKVEKIEK